MAIDTFTTCASLGDLPVDQRLNYVFGQVLGVQEFRQEQVYFINKNRLHNRALHGYGTVWGLELTLDGTGDNREVRVGPGLAVDQCGQEIEVPSLQCARLNAWLAADSGKRNADNRPLTNAETLHVNGGPREVYVTLCYSECLTGDQPVFGEPCRSDSQAIQPTRVKDDFSLDLAAESPLQDEELMVRSFGALLGRVGLGDVPTADREARRAELLKAVADLSTAPAPGGAPLVLPPDEARDWLREAFRRWVVLKRPPLQPARQPCILLGAVELSLDGNKVDETKPIALDEEQRPYLLHTRLLQEWLLSSRGGGGKGEKGDPGPSGVDSVEATTLDEGKDATATYDRAQRKITFGIPEGKQGDRGPVGVEGIEKVTTVPAGAPAKVTLDPATRKLTFDIPQGETGVKDTKAKPLPAGANPTAEYNSATRVITFGLPKGDKGDPGDGGASRIAFINPNMMSPRGNATFSFFEDIR